MKKELGDIWNWVTENYFALPPDPFCKTLQRVLFIGARCAALRRAAPRASRFGSSWNVFTLFLEKGTIEFHEIGIKMISMMEAQVITSIGKIN